MAYRFRLESLLNVRNRMMEVAEADLAKAATGLNNALAYEKEVQDRLSDAKQELMIKMDRGIMAHEYKWLQDRISILEVEDEQALSMRKEAEKALVEARAEVAERHRDVQLLERLKERNYKEYMAEIMRQAQIEADDMASTRFKHERRG